MKLASLVSFRTIWLAGVALAISAVAFSATVALTGGLPVPTTATDFRQYGSSFSSGLLPMQDSPNCSTCHGGYDVNQEPYTRWASSMMAQSVRDPVFQAAFAIANQDLGQSGYLCLRCHVPGAWLGGRAAPDGSAVDPSLGDHDGVNCHVCHRMIDPFYEPGVSPAVDQSILASIGPLPFSVGGGQMVIDPDDVRRGPFDLGPNFFLHDWLPSPFHRESLMCATCHEVSNPATSRMPDGSYELNAYHTRHPTADKLDQFPNERTYSEWAQSVYAQAPIETNGRFGGNVSSVSTCQDCHMPKTTGTACQPVLGGAVRNDLPLHDFHGANSWVLDAVRNLYPDNVSGLSAQSVADAHARNAAYLANASDLDLYVVGTDLGVRVVNHAGHKLPTGYSEGRRMWINVRFFDSQDNLVAERGAYDGTTATLTTADTKVYEANHGLDATMAAVTGQPEAPSLHFMLTNKIYKDNRIPPRGFSFDAFEAVQSEPVAASYAEQQYWDDTLYSVPGQAKRAEVRVYHQTTIKEYIEFLRDTNTTDNKGQIAYDQWVATGMSAPVLLDMASIDLQNGDCRDPLPIGVSKPLAAGGYPRLFSSGSPTVTANNFALEIRNAKPNVLATIFKSSATATTPYIGGTLYLAQPLVRLGGLTLDATGGGTRPIPVTGAMAGTSQIYQVIFRDSQASSSLGITNALHVDFCQ